MRRDALRDERRNEERDDHRRRRTRTNNGRQLVLSCAVLISSSLIIRRPACRLGSSVPPGSPSIYVPSSSIIVHRPARFAVPRLVPRSVIRSSCRPVRLPFFYRPPVKTCPIHGSGLAAKGVGSGDVDGAFFYAPFSSAHYRSSCHQVLLAVGRLIVSAPVVAASTMVPCHLIRLIHLVRPIAPVHQIVDGMGPASLKQTTTSRRPSHHGGSPGSSSHPFISFHSRHGASRLSSRWLISSCVSGRRLAQYTQDINGN